MNGSSANNGGTAGKRGWLRRLHRWLGIAVLCFVLLLAATGIPLNHSAEWRLAERHVQWQWLLAAYGIEAPAPAASFADGGHRATLLGDRLYFDGQELAREVDALSGTVSSGGTVVVAADRDVFLLTPGGELVERMRLGERLPGAIAALGRAGERVVVRSGAALYRFDGDLLDLEPWPEGASDGVRWSAETPAAAGELAAIEALYRGRGVTVERLLADLHSGRIVARLGPLVMDLVAVLLIVLSLTGLWMWRQRGGNGQRRGRR